MTPFRKEREKQALLVLTGLILLVVLSLIAIKFRSGLFKRSLSESERVGKLLDQDRANLTRKDASEYEIYAALIRLSQEQDPEARTLALEYTKSPSRVIREGVANALGYFDDDEAMELLTKMLSDPEKSVRLQAIQSFGHKPGTRREKIILNLLKDKRLSGEEKGAAHSTLIQVASTPNARNLAIGKVITLIRSTNDPHLISQATMMIVATAPKDPRVIAVLKYVLEHQSTSFIDAMGVRHLASIGDPWLKLNLSKFASRKDLGTRMAVIQSIHLACPKERWSIFENLFRAEKDRGLLGLAVQELRYMPGPDTKVFLNKMIEKGVLKGDDAALGRKVLFDLESLTAPDPCGK